METSKQAELLAAYAEAEKSAWEGLVDHLKAQHRAYLKDANDACEKLKLIEAALDNAIEGRSTVLKQRQTILAEYRSQVEQARTDTQ